MHWAYTQAFATASWTARDRTSVKSLNVTRNPNREWKTVTRSGA